MPPFSAPPRSMLKACRRLNPCVDLDVDIVAVSSGAGASTQDDWQGEHTSDDSFTDLDGTFLEYHVGELGTTWTRHPALVFTGGIQISSHGDIFIGGNTANSTLAYFASGAPRTPDYNVEVVVRARTLLAGGGGVCGRMDTVVGTYYTARYFSGNWELYKFIAGVATLLGSSPVTLTVGVDYTLMLKMAGSAISLFVNGVSVISVSDAAIAGPGRAGFRFSSPAYPVVNTDDTGIHFDNFAVFPNGRLTNTTADSDGTVRLTESGNLSIFKSAGAHTDATVKKTFTNLDNTQTLWIDFWPDPSVFGPNGFVVDSIDLHIGSRGAAFFNMVFQDMPAFAVVIARLDENWNRETMTAPLTLYGRDMTESGGLVHIDFRGTGHLVRINTGRIRSRTGSGRDSSGVERTNDFTVEGDKKVSHLEINQGFSIGLIQQIPQVVPFIGGLPDPTYPKFDVNTSWRCTEPVGKSMGPYSPDANGASALDTKRYPGYGFAETGFVPGFGAKDTLALTGGVANGKWGISGQVSKQDIDHVGNNIFDQPWHDLKAVTYHSTGTAITVLDLGHVPTQEVHFRADASTPNGTSIVYSVRGANDAATWSLPWTPADGDVFTGAHLYRYYEVTVILNATSDGLTTPSLDALFVTERIRYATWKYSRDFDSSSTIDPTTGQSSIGELKLPLLRLGRGDYNDIVTKIASEFPLANVEAWLYLRQTISGERWFLNLYRLEDRELDLGEESMTFVSGMDRLKVTVPPKIETDQYPRDGSTAIILSHHYDSGSRNLTITVTGTPFSGFSVAGWRFEGLTGQLAGANFFILGSLNTFSDVGVLVTNSFTIILEADSQEPTDGDEFILHSDLTTRTEVNYSGQDFADVYKDLIRNQAAVPERYRGVLPPTTGRTTTGFLDSNGRTAIEPLQEVALHCGGALAWNGGRIDYVDLYGVKTSQETWSEKDYVDLKPNVGANRRMPSIDVKYGYDRAAGAFLHEASFEDANALLGMGRANLFDTTELADSLCQWNDQAEASHLGNKLLVAWSSGVRIWSVTLATPRPWRKQGDAVTISTDQYVDRRLRFSGDGITDSGSPIKGRISAVGVIVGKNLDGTQFEVAIFGLDSITSSSSDGTVENFTDFDKTINNLKWTDSADGTLRTYTWDRGAAVDQVFVYDTLEAAPPTVDPWPSMGDPPDSSLPIGTDFYTATRPVRGFQRYIQLEPRLLDLTSGALKRVVLEPTPPVAPTVRPRITLSTNRDTADVFLILESGDNEHVGCSLRDSETGPVYVLCVSNVDTTPRYAPSGTEIGPTDYFYTSGSPVQKLNDLPLTRDQISRIYAQAHGEISLIDSTWVPIPLSLKEQPWLESISLLWDNATGQLRVRVKGGANTASVFIEVSASSSFSSPSTDSSALADGGEYTSTFTLSGTQRGKTWYARATPFNAASLGGLAGVAVIDQTPVPSIYTIVSTAATEVTSTGIGTITIVIDDPGSVIHATNKIKFYRTVLGVRTLVSPTTAPGGSTTTGTYTLDSTLDAKHNIKVEAIIFFVDGSSAIIWTGTFDRDKSANVLNLAQAVDGANSTVTAFFDTDTVIGASKAQYRIDGGAWVALTVAADYTSRFTIALTAALQIAEVQGKDSDGNFGPSAFIHLDVLPGAAQGTVSIDANGIYAWSQDGSSAQASVLYAESTSAFPSDATVRASGTLINGRQVTRATGGPLTFGQTIFITIIPYSLTGGTGTELPSIRLRGSYQTFSATKVANFAPRLLHENTNPPRGMVFDSDNNIIPPGLPTTGSQEQFSAAVDIPNGTTITLVEFDILDPGGLGDSPSSFSVGLARMVSHVRTGLGFSGPGFSGSWQTVSISFSESVSAGRSYALEVQLQGVIISSFGSAIRIGPMRITYTTPEPTASR